MFVSVFLAKAFALYFLIMGLAMLTNQNYYMKAAIGMVENNGLAFLTSIFTLILGILLVLFHDVWIVGWPLIITILAWLTLIKGILRLFLPRHVVNWLGLIQNKSWFFSSMILFIVLGVYLGYIGFVAYG